MSTQCTTSPRQLDGRDISVLLDCFPTLPEPRTLQSLSDNYLAVSHEVFRTGQPAIPATI